MAKKESKQPKPTELSSDRPETDPSRDLLGYAPFASQLAASISAGIPDDGFVIGVYAPWGAGKSTLLNFTEAYLTKDKAPNSPIVVRFNPWWFSGDETLIRNFFGQLNAALTSKAEHLADKVRNSVASLAIAVSDSPIPAPDPLTNLGKRGLKVLGTYLKTIPDVDKLKADISSVLRAQPRTIVVIVDDIDRLTPAEIRQLFRLIKAVADFPKVCYLMAFDRDVVADALTEGSTKGAEYLEKIVQAPFALPMADRTGLHALLSDRLHAILGAAATIGFDETRWANIFVEGINPQLVTPRDVIRLTNSLAVTYPGVGEDVNPIDFIAVETLRIFEPAVYEQVRQSQGQFVGPSEERRDTEPLKDFHLRWLDTVDEASRESVKKLVTHLFPKVAAALGGSQYGSDWLTEWRKQKRVCSPDCFQVYFRLSLPAGSVSTAEMQRLLQSLESAEEFAQVLESYGRKQRPDGGSMARTVLERLQDYTEAEIPVGAIPVAFQVLTDIGDELASSDKVTGMFEFGTDLYIGRLFWQLLRRLPQTSRFPTLESAFRQGRALSTICREIAVLGQQQGKRSKQSDPENQWLVTAAELTRLEKLAVNRIREEAKNKQLHNRYRLPAILFDWLNWANPTEVKTWCAGIVADRKKLLPVLEQFCGEVKSQGFGERTVRTTLQFNYDSFVELFDAAAVADRLSKIGKVGSPAERNAAVLFLAAHRRATAPTDQEPSTDPAP